MTYANSIRTAAANFNTVASLIEGIFSSTYDLTWTTYSMSATQSASGSMTFASGTADYSKYIQVGKLVIWLVRYTGTTGTLASTTLYLTLPVTATSNTAIFGGGWVVDTGAVLGASVAGNSTTTVGFSKYDASNFGLGASRIAAGVIIYEAA